MARAGVTPPLQVGIGRASGVPEPVLADALMDAGCEHQGVLGHCRGGGEHVRGCWVVDHVLGKS
jgi:hypothetical protein